jgi:dTDP-4-amino-4,6-dideoxygalactose transaminase
MGRQLCGELHLPQTEQLSTRLLRLPFFFEITEQQQSDVVGVLEEIFLAGQRTSTAVNS